tara:strand:+ start:307 stop:903 length:597 start_codon:yes stop_codon:yes gene_type:complete
MSASMSTSTIINEIGAALVKAQGLIENPTKSVKNDFFKSKYADLAGVIDVVRPAFTEAGIAIVQSPFTREDGKIGVCTTIVHTSGQWMSNEVSMAVDPNAKNPAQAAGSLITYLRRYSLSAFANVAQEDDDGNSLKVADKPVRKSLVQEKEVSIVVDLLQKTKTDIGKVLLHFKIESLPEMDLSQFKQAVELLESKLK